MHMNRSVSNTFSRAQVLTFAELQGTDNTTAVPKFAPVTSQSLIFGAMPCLTATCDALFATAVNTILMIR